MRTSLRHFLLVLVCALAVAGISAASATAAPGLTYTPIAFPGHTNATWAWGINPAGAVSGEYWAGVANQSQAFGFYEQNGVYTPIVDPNQGPYDEMNAMQVTQSGDVIGGFYGGTDAASAGLNGRVYIYHIDSGQFTKLNDPKADGVNGAGCTVNNQPVQCGTWPLAANFSGEVVGLYFTSAGHLRGFTYQNGKFTTVNYPDQPDNALTGVTDQGLTAGQAFNAKTHNPNAVPSWFLYSPQGGFVTFPDLTDAQAPGIFAPQAYEMRGINDYGLRSGTYFAPSTSDQCSSTVENNSYGWVDLNGQFTDLTLPFAPGVGSNLPNISDPYTCQMELFGANEAGQIAGLYSNTSPNPQTAGIYGFVVNTGS